MEYLTAFILGLVGSLHCAGMCGPLALALPSAGNSTLSYFGGRAAYNLGRIITYCTVGLVVGVIGKSLVLAGLQRWVSIVLGVMLIAGLVASRKLALAKPVTFFVERLKAGMGSLLRERSFLALALLGSLNGLLPCGLVYVAAAGATVVVSWAASVAATGRATTTAAMMRLERQIVVLLIQRLRERVERLGLAFRRHLRRRLGAREIP